ncbi:nSTAND1 domain-containing NTPase [Maritalea sp.]|uniref:nSTAND1 domain-containing NTPase n=1 Tax=Maritalea sp. TaxID=2003361 RepID=UPI003EF95949
MTVSSSASGIPEIKIFLSSPGDVNEERVLAGRVLQRLTERYAPLARLVPIIWEHEPLLASATFQDQIDKPSTTDIVICILWSRLGTRLPPHIVREDGSRYDSGTEFEFEDAFDAIQRTGRPDLLVYRKMAEPFISLASNTEAEERLRQKRALDGFIQKWFHDEDGSLLAAFHGFGNSAEFEEAFEMHLDKLVQRRLEELGVDSLKTTAVEMNAEALWEGSPFRGLETFEFEHAPVFYGRTHAISGVLKTLRAQAAQGNAFVLVLGRSGGGKSSLVRAGVLPLLVEPGVVEGVGLWRRAVFHPSEASGSLNRAFAAALSADMALPELLSDGTSVDELGDLLDSTPKGADMLLKGALSQAAQKVAAQAAETYAQAHPDLDAAQLAYNRRAILENPPKAKLVLLVDQLEELFTDTSIPQSEREGFLDALSALAASGRVYVVATLRSDFYQHAIEHPTFAQLKGSEGQYDLSAPTPAEIGQIIRQPALRAGLTFEEHPETGARLDDDLRDAAVAEPDSLPLLEFALEELYRARSPSGVLTWEAYEALGGLAGALGRRAEEAFNALPAAAQATLPRVMRQIVYVRLDRDQAATKRSANIANFPPDTPIKELIDTFVAARLFVVGGDSAGNTVVTLTHEALLSSWPRLREWLAADQEFLRIRARVNFAADRWEEAGREAQLLLPTGPALNEARQITGDQDANTSSTVAQFIALSVKRATRVRRLKRSAIAALALLTFAASGTAWYADGQRREAASARGVSEQAQAEAETNAETAQARLGELFFEQGRRALLDGRAEEATLLLGAAYGSTPKDQTGALFSTARALASIKGGTTLESSTAITNLAAGPNNLMAIAAADGSIAIRNMSTGDTLARRIADDDPIKTLAFSPDGRIVAAGADSGKILLWSFREQSTRQLDKHFQAITKLFFSTDGTQLASLSHDKTTRIWNVTDGAQIATLPEQGGVPVSAAFSEDGFGLTTLTSEGEIAQWDSRTGREVFRCNTQAPQPVLDGIVLGGASAVLALGDSGVMQVTADADCQTNWMNPIAAFGLTTDTHGSRILVRNGTQAALVDRATGDTIFKPNTQDVGGSQRQIIAATLTADARMIGVIDTAGTMTLLDAFADGVVLAKFDGHAASGSAIAFSDDGNSLLTAAVDGTVTSWNLSALRPCVMQGAAGQTLAFSPDGTYVASGDSIGQITLAEVDDCSTGRVLGLNRDQEWVRDIRFSADSRQIAATAGGLVSLIDVQSGNPVWEYRLDDAHLASAISWNADNSALFVGTRGRELGSNSGGWLELDRTTGQKVNQSKKIQTPVSSIDFWNDDTYVLTQSDVGLLLWWQDTGRHRLTVAGRQTRAAVYWPDRTRIAVGNASGQVRVMRHTSSELFRFNAHNAPVSALAIDESGLFLASGANDGTAALWDTTTGALIARLIGHSSKVASMTFVPNSPYVLSAATNGTVMMWDLTSGSLVARFDGPSGPKPELAVDPAGAWFGVATGRGSTRLWRLPKVDVPASDIISEISAVTPWGLKLNDDLPQDRWQALALEALVDQLSEGDKAVSVQARQRLEQGRIAAVRGDALSAARSWQQIGQTDPVDGQTTVALPKAYQHALASNSVALEGLTRVLDDHKERVENIVFSHDGSVMATVDWAKKLIIWNTGDWTKRFEFEDGFASGISFSPDNTTLLTQDAAGGLVAVDLATGVKGACFAQGRHGVWSPDSKRIAAFPRIGAPIIYDAVTGVAVMTFPNYDNPTRGFAISKDFGTVSAPTDASVVLLDTVSRSVAATIVPEKNQESDASVSVNKTVFSADGALIAVLWSDETGHIYSAQDGTLRLQLPDKTTDIVFSADGQNLLVDIDDDKVVVLNVKNGGEITRVHGSLGSGDSFLHGAQSFSTVDGGRRSIQVYDRETGSLTSEYVGHATAWVLFAEAPDGTARVTTSGDGQLRIWDTTRTAGQWRPAAEPIEPLEKDVLARLSQTEQVVRRNGRVLLTSPNDGEIVLSGHRGDVTAASFSTQGDMLFTGGEDGRLLIRDKQSSTLLNSVLEACEQTVSAVLPTVEAEAVWVYCSGGRLKLFDTSTGRALIAHFGVPPHTGEPVQMLFTKDGKALLLTGEDGPYQWKIAP